MNFMTLQQRIELERGKKEPEEVLELNLDNAKGSKIEGLTDGFVNLEVLSLISVGLQSVNGLPNLPSLRTLELSNNFITGGLESLLNAPNLEQLNLSNNKIESLDVLQPLSKLEHLRSLDLSNCPVCATEHYRKKAFLLIPSLKYLDGLDENEEEEPIEEVTNGRLEDGDEDDDDDEDEEDEDEIGIEALQQSGDLEDEDDEDYAPAENEDTELDDYDDVDDDDEVEDEESGINLSGADVTGTRRPSGKRRHDDADVSGSEDDDACQAKIRPVDGTHNGATLDK